LDVPERADSGPGDDAKEDGIGGGDSRPTVSWSNAGKRIGTRAAGVVGSVGDGLATGAHRKPMTVRVGGLKPGGKAAPANVTLGVKGFCVSPKKNAPTAFKIEAAAACAANAKCKV
jgi:hypothetical protein